MSLSKRHVSIGLLAVPWLAGCPSSNNDKDGGPDGAVTCSMPGGPVTGMADNHCIDPDGGAMMIQATDQASCHPDAMVDPDAGMMMGPMYGMTMNGSEGDDDDCKYHVKWTSTPICKGGDVTFTVTVTRKNDGKPAAMAHPYAEAFQRPSHLGPDRMPVTAEPQPGVYTIGPYDFDVSGKWEVRFHFFAECEDTLMTSPHGHAAFFVSVP